MLFSPEEQGISPGYVSYIECFRCGQAFNLGRYPLHFHMMVRIDALTFCSATCRAFLCIEGQG